MAPARWPEDQDDQPDPLSDGEEGVVMEVGRTYVNRGRGVVVVV